MIGLFSMRSTVLEEDFELLHRTFTVIVYGMLVTLCGLALAAIVG
jgi:hypothetical protein